MHTKQRGDNWGRSRCREHLRSPRSIVSWRSSGTWHYRITFCRRIPHQISAITRRRKREQRGERKELTLEIRTGKEQWHYLLKYHKEIIQIHDNSCSRKGVKENTEEADHPPKMPNRNFNTSISCRETTQESSKEQLKLPSSNDQTPSADLLGLSWWVLKCGIYRKNVPFSSFLSTHHLNKRFDSLSQKSFDSNCRYPCWWRGEMFTFCTVQNVRGRAEVDKRCLLQGAKKCSFCRDYLSATSNKKRDPTAQSSVQQRRQAIGNPPR